MRTLWIETENVFENSENCSKLLNLTGLSHTFGEKIPVKLLCAGDAHIVEKNNKNFQKLTFHRFEKMIVCGAHGGVISM